MYLNELKNPIISNNDGTCSILLYETNYNCFKYTKILIKDIHKICNRKWFICSNGYAVSYKGSKSTYMSNLIVGTNRTVDHINNNKLDNRRDNLRVVTKQQNSFNKSPSKNRTSSYKGVSLCKETNKWVVRIRDSNIGKYLNLGRYDSEKMAAIVYNEKAKILFGEHAWLNEVSD